MMGPVVWLSGLHTHKKVKNSTFSVWISKYREEKPSFGPSFDRNVTNPNFWRSLKDLDMVSCFQGSVR